MGPDKNLHGWQGYLLLSSFIGCFYLKGGTDSEKVLVPLKLLKFLRSLLNHVFKRCLPFPQEKKNNSNTHKVRNDNFYGAASFTSL